MTGSVFLFPLLPVTQFALFIPIGPDSAGQPQPPPHIYQIGQPLERLAGVFCGHPGEQAGHYKLDLWHFPKCPNFCLYRFANPFT